MASHDAEKVKESVKDYYGKRLKNSDDLKTNACELGEFRMSPEIKEAMKLVHEEVSSKFYGCGLVAPEALEGMNILDLGSGSGKDCFVLSKLVGENGHVTGVDMTEEQVNIANKYIAYHAERFGYSTPNTAFKLGEIERLAEVGIEDNSMDIIISNCVVNLTADKKVVLKEAYRVLKNGGEMYFSDVYADQEVSEEIKKDKVLWGEGLSGALHWKELERLSKEVGFSGPYLVTSRPFEVQPELRKAVGDTKYVAATYRLFKVGKENITEGSQVWYKGSIRNNPDVFNFDVNSVLTKTSPKIVPADVAAILGCSRFAKHFELQPLDPGTRVPCCVSSGSDPFAYCAANRMQSCCAKSSQNGN